MVLFRVSFGLFRFPFFTPIAHLFYSLLFVENFSFILLGGDRRHFHPAFTVHDRNWDTNGVVIGLYVRLVTLTPGSTTRETIRFVRGLHLTGLVDDLCTYLAPFHLVMSYTYYALCTLFRFRAVIFRRLSLVSCLTPPVSNHKVNNSYNYWCASLEVQENK